jgi:hypothetical protein
MSANPMYCDREARDVSLHDDSPCLPENNPWGVLIGAHDAGGCGTSAPEEGGAAAAFRLLQPIPNPCSGPAELAYEILRPCEAPVMDILSVGGRRVRRFADIPSSPGEHRVVWDGRDESGASVASGVYLVRATAEGVSRYSGLVLVR